MTHNPLFRSLKQIRREIQSRVDREQFESPKQKKVIRDVYLHEKLIALGIFGNFNDLSWLLRSQVPRKTFSRLCKLARKKGRYIALGYVREIPLDKLSQIDFFPKSEEYVQ